MSEGIKAIDMIRMRPAVLYGSQDKFGYICAIKRVIAYCMPYCDKVNVKLLKDNILVLDFIGLDMRVRDFWVETFISDDIHRKDETMDDFFAFRATCDYMKAYFCREEKGLQDYRYYKDGKFMEKRMTYLDDMEPLSLRVEYKPSKNVFNFKSIFKKDLNFLKVV